MSDEVKETVEVEIDLPNKEASSEIQKEIDKLQAVQDKQPEIVIEEQKEEVKETKPEKEIKSEEKLSTKKEEDKKEDDFEKHKTRVQKRISELTWKLREAERKENEAIAYAKKIKEESESIRKKFTSMDSNYLTEFESRIKSQKLAIRDKLKAAIESQNAEEIANANEALARLTVDEERVRVSKLERESEAKEVPVKQEAEQVKAVQQPVIQPDPKAEEWASKNPWFGKDEAMTYTALALHKKLIENEGYDAKSDEYYEAIDSYMKKKFPQEFTNEEKSVSKDEQNTNVGSRKPVQSVASATRTTKSGRKTVRLTSAQVNVAKRLNVPLSEYAKYVKEQ